MATHSFILFCALTFIGLPEPLYANPTLCEDRIKPANAISSPTGELTTSPDTTPSQSINSEKNVYEHLKIILDRNDENTEQSLIDYLQFLNANNSLESVQKLTLIDIVLIVKESSSIAALADELKHLIEQYKIELAKGPKRIWQMNRKDPLQLKEEIISKAKNWGFQSQKISQSIDNIKSLIEQYKAALAIVEREKSILTYALARTIHYSNATRYIAGRLGQLTKLESMLIHHHTFASDNYETLVQKNVSVVSSINIEIAQIIGNQKLVLMLTGPGQSQGTHTIVEQPLSKADRAAQKRLGELNEMLMSHNFNDVVKLIEKSIQSKIPYEQAQDMIMLALNFINEVSNTQKHRYSDLSRYFYNIGDIIRVNILDKRMSDEFATAISNWEPLNSQALLKSLSKGTSSFITEFTSFYIEYIKSNKIRTYLKKNNDEIYIAYPHIYSLLKSGLINESDAEAFLESASFHSAYQFLIGKIEHNNDEVAFMYIRILKNLVTVDGISQLHCHDIKKLFLLLAKKSPEATRLINLNFFMQKVSKVTQFKYQYEYSEDSQICLSNCLPFDLQIPKNESLVLYQNALQLILESKWNNYFLNEYFGKVGTVVAIKNLTKLSHLLNDKLIAKIMIVFNTNPSHLEPLRKKPRVALAFLKKVLAISPLSGLILGSYVFESYNSSTQKQDPYTVLFNSYAIETLMNPGNLNEPGIQSHWDHHLSKFCFGCDSRSHAQLPLLRKITNQTTLATFVNRNLLRLNWKEEVWLIDLLISKMNQEGLRRLATTVFVQPESGDLIAQLREIVLHADPATVTHLQNTVFTMPHTRTREHMILEDSLNIPSKIERMEFLNKYLPIQKEN